MRKLPGALTSTLLTVGLAASFTPLLASPAAAASMYDCTYPQVCVYEGPYASRNVNGSFQSTAYQNMPTGIQNDPDAVVNTRNDDSVWLIDTRPSPDAYICIPKNRAVNLGNYDHPIPERGTWANDVDTIKIWGDPDDGLCSGANDVRQGRIPDGWRP
ncbi:hypothetical protein [Streptomyces resistomycificus]|uniref:Peptidase inhibitor family I36 n=1 Tax=Streptomyces resistomycificus TaxID=67356 RepID=A0A0L8KXK5_9ACTN|nr:hypothetical protein [Streptomyces resistomycificus]KOG30544.1 hypothetical protein ADK37_33915 [Streptomyces resistomycificus]KUO02160.1 hypothetical protein AQJ84_00355 [Streptomyces resistomycificus]